MTTPPQTDEVAEALEATESAIDSKQRGCLDEWELHLVKRRIKALTQKDDVAKRGNPE